MVDPRQRGRIASGQVLVTVLLAMAAWAPGAPAHSATRFFGHYVGQATVTTSPFYAPGIYDAEVAIAQTPSGVVGYVNIVFDAADLLGGTITYKFSSPLDGDSNVLSLQYSDRQCGTGDPPDQCHPHAGFPIQYSFQGSGVAVGKALTLAGPSILPDLPYGADLPFDSVQATRMPSPPRSGFDGVYHNLEYIWMGTVLLPLPLPLHGTNYVVIDSGEILVWVTDGLPVSVPGIVTAWCFDDDRGLGWMNQQGLWFFDWVLDPDGQGLNVMVSSLPHSPDCRDLQEPFAGDIDQMHGVLKGILFELAPTVTGPGTVRGLRLDREAGGTLQLTWNPDCGTGTRYAVYRGNLAEGYGSLLPVPGHCGVSSTSASIPLGGGAADFFLVVPNDGQSEGSYGIDSQGVPRSPSALACHASATVDSCAP